MKKPDVRSYLATPGFVIRDPRTKARVPCEGEPIRVEFSNYWARREADGSVFTPVTITESAPSKRVAKSTTEG